MPLMSHLLEDLANHLHAENRLSDQDHAAILRKLRRNRMIGIGVLALVGGGFWFLVISAIWTGAH